NREVYAINQDGTGTTRLTNNNVADGDPSWSPSGGQLAFESFRDGDSEVYTMNNDGSSVTRLTFATGEDRGTSWTSDGKIVFHSQRVPGSGGVGGEHGNFDVFIMNADGTDQVNLTPGTENSQDSAAYACGNSTSGKIVFNTNRDGNFEIYSINMDGTGVTRLTNNLALDSGPTWSPDCSQIAFNSAREDNQLDVYKMNADGSGVVNLTNSKNSFDAFSAWSPDGSKLVYSSDDLQGDFELYTMNAADGSGRTRITFSRNADLRSDWGTAAYLVVGPPTSAEQCKDDGWRNFNNPVFQDQGDCVDEFGS
ncbi:MAG: TolB family protein, partial [Actinomycetota bacterium]